MLLWLALGVASLAVLGDLANHWWTSAWSRYSLLFVPLAVLAALRAAPARAPQTGLGTALVGLGVLIEVLAVGGGFERVGRLGLALALVGMTCFHGVEGWARRLCVLWIVPIPHALAQALGQIAMPVWAALGAAATSWIDPGSGYSHPAAWLDSSGLYLRGPASGLPAVAVLAGLGWHASALAGADLRSASLRALRWGALGIPIQAAAVVVAAFGLGWAGLEPPTVRNAVLHLPWLCAAALGMTLLARTPGLAGAAAVRAEARA